MNITDEKRYRHRLEQRRYVERLKKEGRKPAQGSKEAKDRFYQNNPWFKYYNSARTRTVYENRRYCQRGLSFSMTVNDFKDLWFRDKAEKLIKPSVDRIYGNVGYEKWNCRFIELEENKKRKSLLWCPK